MAKFMCSVCGYIYDEAVGDPDSGIVPGTKWEDIPEDWSCPLCGATKAEFTKKQESNSAAPQTSGLIEQTFSKEYESADEMRELSFGELSVLCSNLAKGCEKQYRPEEAVLFNRLSEYYKGKTKPVGENQLRDLISCIQTDLTTGYPQANSVAANNGDRGALRALTWGEKVTKIVNSLLTRYEKQKDALLENTNVYVCEICGFVYIGEEAPEICPVCKVPRMKITQVQRG